MTTIAKKKKQNSILGGVLLFVCLGRFVLGLRGVNAAVQDEIVWVVLGLVVFRYFKLSNELLDAKAK